MNKLLLFLLLSILLQQKSSAQSLDSVLAGFPRSLPDSSKVKQLNNFVWANLHTQPERVKEAAYKALSIAEKSGDKPSLSDCYNTLGALYHSRVENQQSINYHLQAIRIRKELHDVAGLYKSFNNIGVTYQKMGKHREANEYFFKALDPATTLKDSTALATLYLNIGSSYGSLHQNMKAIGYLQKSISYKNDGLSLVNALLNMSNQYFEMKDYRSSENVFNRALPLAKQLNDQYTLARLLSNMSQVYLAEQKYAQAEDAIKQSLVLNEKIGNKNGLCLDYLAMGNLYIKLNQAKHAIDYSGKALPLTRELGLLPLEKAANFQLAEAFASLGQYDKAYDYLKASQNLVDSINKIDWANRFSELEIEHANTQKEKALALLKQQKINQDLETRNLYTLIAVGALTIMVVAVVLWGRFKRFKLKQQLSLNEELYRQKELRIKAVSEAENEERSRIAKDIHDDLGSGLSKIRFLTRHLMPETPPEMIPMLDSIAETSGNLVENMRELIWIADPQNNGLDGLVARIREYTSDYLQDYTDELSFDIDQQLPHFPISREAYRHLLSSVKESLQNIVKHSDATSVKLSIRLENDELFIIITDNGKGFHSDHIANGNGLQNVNYRLTKLNGKVIFDSKTNQGTTVKMSVQLENIKTAITTLVV